MSFYALPPRRLGFSSRYFGLIIDCDPGEISVFTGSVSLGTPLAFRFRLITLARC